MHQLTSSDQIFPISQSIREIYIRQSSPVRSTLRRNEVPDADNLSKDV